MGLRKSFLFTLCAVSIMMGGLGATAFAAPTELFFSEYIEGTSNNKALEIFNGTGAAIDLGAAGYNVQMFSNGSSSATLTINLTGTVSNDDVFVLAHSSASGTILTEADQTAAGSWFNGNDAVALRKGTTAIDVIGQVGVDPGTQWGTGLISTADNTLRRKSSIFAGDTDGSDAFNPSVEWEGFATDTFGGLGAHTIASVPEPAAIFLIFGAFLGVAGFKKFEIGRLGREPERLTTPYTLSGLCRWR